MHLIPKLNYIKNNNSKSMEAEVNTLPNSTEVQAKEGTHDYSVITRTSLLAGCKTNDKF